MKKNLRIVSAAAAALLAVAPVAASAVATPATTVQAAATQYNDQIGTLGTTADLGTIALGDTSASNIKSTIQKQVAKQLNVSDAQLTDFNVSVASDGKTTVTFGVSSATAKDKNWNGSVNGLSWRKAGENASDGNLYTNAGLAKYTVTVEKTSSATNSSDKINAGSSSIYDADANVAVNISAVAAKAGLNSAVNGNVVVTLDGTQFTAMLVNDANGNNVTITNPAGTDVKKLQDGVEYTAQINDVKVNLGNKYANTTQTLNLPKNATFASNDATNGKHTLKVSVNNAGVADLGAINVKFYAYNPANMKEVHFYDVNTGNVVTSGSLNLHAVNGKVSLQSLFIQLAQKYTASQLYGETNVTVDTLVPQNDLRDQLKKQNIDVDANGYFTAPSSFTVNFGAKSNLNGATASLPVTVSVDNAAQTPAANETTKNVKIMHISTVYDKTGKATNEPALRAYNTVSVVTDPVTINGAKFYKLAGKDQYIKVGNVDGTSRSLKHNSYVYKSSGKRANKKTLKKGSSVTTYGKSFMIAGHQMYRIGENQYVKKANF